MNSHNPIDFWMLATHGLQESSVSGAFRPVRFLVLFVALSCPLQADLIAHVQTTLGNVDVALQYDKAPQAVANFITLAQGTRRQADPFTGVVTNSQYYIGEKFFRVVDEAGFKIAQTGSGTGTNSGGPGYTFKDEFHPTLTHVPYVLSMANSGPNSNGSQIYFTGNTSIPSLDNVHTIFGLVTEPASRSVIDAIHAAGNNGSSITGITFSRTDPAAIAFDEHAQNLPIVSCPGGSLTVQRGVAAIWNLNPLISTGEIFHAFYSTTMTPGSWVELDYAKLHVGISQGALLTPVATTAPLDGATAPKAFYNLYVADHPGSVAPSYLNNRTVTIPLGGDTLKYVFNNSGVSGTATFTPAGGSPITGPFTTVNPGNGDPLAPSTDAHSFVFTADTPILNPRYFWIKVGCDTASNSLVTGRHSTQYYNGIFGWAPFGTGPVTITR